MEEIISFTTGLGLFISLIGLAHCFYRDGQGKDGDSPILYLGCAVMFWFVVLPFLLFVPLYFLGQKKKNPSKSIY